MSLVQLAAAEAEPSKLPFYVCGAVLVAWAVAVSALGIARRGFPATKAQSRGVLTVSLVLVAATLASVLATS